MSAIEERKAYGDHSPWKRFIRIHAWVNLVDLGVTKVFRFGNTKIEPTVDLYNIFNNNAVTNAVTTIGASLGRPSAIVMGRLLRLGGRTTF